MKERGGGRGKKGIYIYMIYRVDPLLSAGVVSMRPHALFVYARAYSTCTMLVHILHACVLYGESQSQWLIQMSCELRNLNLNVDDSNQTKTLCQGKKTPRSRQKQRKQIKHDTGKNNTRMQENPGHDTPRHNTPGHNTPGHYTLRFCIRGFVEFEIQFCVLFSCVGCEFPTLQDSRIRDRLWDSKCLSNARIKPIDHTCKNGERMH